MRPSYLAVLLLSAVLPAAAFAQAQGRHDMVVIVNPASHISALTRDQVIDIFMGRFRQLPSGAAALPIDLADTTERRIFYRELIHWSLAEVGSYWARLVFSGQANPPHKAPDARAAVELVAHNPDAIAYVERSAVTKQVRVVLDLGKP